MATTKKTSMALAASAVMTAGLALSPGMASAENPFATAELPSGYMQVAEHHAEEGKCGEAKCGADKKAKEAKCGGDKKAEEGKCGGDKKAEEGKCGEAKCGGDKK